LTRIKYKQNYTDGKIIGTWFINRSVNEHNLKNTFNNTWNIEILKLQPPTKCMKKSLVAENQRWQNLIRSEKSSRPVLIRYNLKSKIISTLKDLISDPTRSVTTWNSKWPNTRWSDTRLDLIWPETWSDPILDDPILDPTPPNTTQNPKWHVRPFFASLLTQERNQVSTAEERDGITLGCIFMYFSLGLYIKRLFLVIVETLLFKWAQSLTVNYSGLWLLGTFDFKKKRIRI
jgi:hypothetical protein